MGLWAAGRVWNWQACLKLAEGAAPGLKPFFARPTCAGVETPPPSVFFWACSCLVRAGAKSNSRSFDSAEVRFAQDDRAFLLAPPKIILRISVAPAGLVGAIHALSQGCAALTLGYSRRLPPGANCVSESLIFIFFGGPQVH